MLATAPRPTPKYAPPTEYNPRHDRHFRDRVLADLKAHWGQWRQLGRLYAPTVDSAERALAVRDVIVYWRHRGYIIEGDVPGHASRGYRVLVGPLSLWEESAGDLCRGRW